MNSQDASFQDHIIGFAAGAALLFTPVIAVGGAGPDALTATSSFLNRVAEEQQLEISLGQLATQRAGSPRVKEFGAHMVEEHTKVSQQLEQLADKEGVRLSPGLSQEHKQQQEADELSRLFGHAFDRAYMNYALQHHETTVEEFAQRVKTLHHQDIAQWMTLTLPILEAHREQALQVKYSLQTNPIR